MKSYISRIALALSLGILVLPALIPSAQAQTGCLHPRTKQFHLDAPAGSAVALAERNPAPEHVRAGGWSGPAQPMGGTP